MMQNPFRATEPSSSPTAYDSFIDIDGFPATGTATLSASFASSPTQSTATTSINIDKSYNIRKLDPSSAVDDIMLDANGGWNGNNAFASGNKHDWPAEPLQQRAEQQPMLFDHRNKLPQRQSSRDQQIFRRTTSSGSTSGSRNNATSYSGSRGSSNSAEKKTSSGSGGGRGGIMFESYETGNNDNATGYGSASRSRGSGSGGASTSQRSVSVMDEIYDGGTQPIAAQRHNASNNRRENAIGRNITHESNGTSNKSFGNSSSPGVASSSTASKRAIRSPTSPDANTLSSRSSTHSATRKTGGVVNKLASIFGGSKQQQNNQRQQKSSPKSKFRSTTNNQGLRQQQTVAGVQFHVHAKQQQSQKQVTSSTPPRIKATQQQQNQTHNIFPSTNNSPPAISPTRSNAQSSVTGYTSGGDSSSYNPTGWPGTVDKRGKTYMMEPSYSESDRESSASASPQKGRRDRAAAFNMMMQDVVQNHLHEQQDEPLVARCKDWSKGDAKKSFNIVDDESYPDQQNHANDDDERKSSGPIDLDDYTSNYHEHVNSQSRNEEKTSGPIDLDEAYERRLQGGRYEVDERTAADVQLEAALGMPNATGMTSDFGKQLMNSSMDRRGEEEGSRTFYSSPPPKEEELKGIDLSGSEERVRASGRRLIYTDEVDFNDEVDFDSYNLHSPQRRIQNMQQQQQPQPVSLKPLSEEALRWKDSQMAPPRPGGSTMLRGYRGFIDKTTDVPNLMDETESDSGVTSLGTGVHSAADVRRQHANMGLALPIPHPATAAHSRQSSSIYDSGSDVFEGIQEEPFGPMEKDILNVNSEDNMNRQQQRYNNAWKVKEGRQQQFAMQQQRRQQHFTHFEEGENLPYSTQFNPFTTATREQRPSHSNHLNIDQSYGASINNDEFLDPSLDISAIASRDSDETEDDYDSLPDLSIYTVEPEMVRQMVRAFRKLCTSQMEMSNSCEESMLQDFEDIVDTKKSFALFEMRSRIMETDIDRSLERRGGTNVEDDIALTPHFRAAARVRDAVIVSKAWRDGATPQDVVTAHLLTRRTTKAYYVRRPIRRIRPGRPPYDVDNYCPQYWLEEVKWLDDTDFMMMRCQSLGAGTMKGFEMFTIGDCQSILLRITSDNCTQLRRELKSAMVAQIEAEELMQEEIDLDGDENIVAEAEQLYRDATVEVKTLSIKLVLADKAFALVRSRMEQLVKTIESLLIQIENVESDDDRTSSSYSAHPDDEGSEGSEAGSYSSGESQDEGREKLIKRAKRAELSAEVAVREALLAKQEVEQIQFEKQREIDTLKEKLADMETKSQVLASENRLGYLNGTQSRNNSYLLEKLEAKSFLDNYSTFGGDVEGAARKDRLKQKFRERRQKKEQSTLPERNQNQQLRNEEVYNHLDFYSRSLNRYR